MRLRVPHLVLAVVFCALSAALSFWSKGLAPAFPGLGVQIEGSFTPGGQYPGEPLPGKDVLRSWGSWSGDDRNKGRISLGPFQAPRVVRFGVGGYPNYDGIQLYLELAGTGQKEPIRVQPDVGERWHLIDAVVPRTWVGRAISLVAVDDGTKIGCWISVSEPIRSRWAVGNHGLVTTLAALVLNALLLGALWWAALEFVGRRAWVAPHWTPLVAAGFVALAGYVTFWIFFLNTTAGRVFSWLLLAGAIRHLWRRRHDETPFGADAAAVAKLLAGVVLLYVALLHLYPTSRNFYDLAANRFRAGLPGDNLIPHYIASNLLHGTPLRTPLGDWLSSDRPPLQSGWQLLTWPTTDLLGTDGQKATGTAAVWLQALWVAAVYGLLRTLQVPAARACAWTAVMALSGFFLQNTVFTWPKLSAGAFACGAFALWVLPATRPRTPRDAMLGAMLAALAWLSHGGIAFAYLALLPWFVWRLLRGEFHIWAIAAAAFALTVVPWICYQKFYDPPGNRLLKWHLGGQVEVDSRGTWETVRDAHRQRGWETWRRTTRENLATQGYGRWSLMFEPSAEDSTPRKDDEFFFPARAMTWWNLGVLALPIALLRRRPFPSGRAHLGLVAWVLGTIAIWCALMFYGHSTVIHQGSYATMLIGFVVLSAWLEFASPRLIFAIAALQLVTLLTTWAPPSVAVGGLPAPGPLLLATLAGIALARTSGIAVAAASARRHLAWGAALAAFIPLLWCWGDFRALFWFGDEWDQLDQISRQGFWPWTFGALGENFVPVLKLTWGGLALQSRGSYFALVVAVWCVHAATVFLLGRWLLRAGFSLFATALTLLVFALAATKVETLGWTIQMTIVEGMFFFVAAAQWWHAREEAGAWTIPALVGLAGLITLSTFSCLNGTLTGIAIAGATLLSRLAAPADRAPWRRRLTVAAVCLVPAIASAVLIFGWTGGNQHNLAMAGLRAPAMFAASYFLLSPFYDFTGLDAWTPAMAVAFGAVKIALLVFAWSQASAAQRRLLLPLLLYDLGYAALLGIGRYHTGLGAATSSRYQYVSLICTLPFLGLAMDALVRRFDAMPRWRGAAIAVPLAAAAVFAAQEWPRTMAGWAEWRGRATRELIFQNPNPPAEGAIPGIPFLATGRAKELAAEYRLH